MVMFKIKKRSLHHELRDAMVRVTSPIISESDLDARSTTDQRVVGSIPAGWATFVRDE